MSCECPKTFEKAINTVRLLAADGVQKANSGHPGMPMGCADFAFTLWSKYMRFNPGNPDWMGRDRFVLSAGHGSMLIYSLLHLFDFDMSIDDLKQFRQWGSKTPGHPEHGHTAGVEVTTGPLASGLASAVGIAIGLKQFNARIHGGDTFNQKVYTMSGDGCMMEGTSHEACAIAGHQKLDNLVLFYDSNSITIEGSTSLAFSEDVGKRFDAYGWNVIKIDGQNVPEINAALTLAQHSKGKPTIIIGTTTIGKGAPHLAGTAKSHGAPLGEEELAATKIAFGFDPKKSFFVPDDVRALCKELIAQKKADAAAWDKKFEAFKASAPAADISLMNDLLNRTVPANIKDILMKAVPQKETATRNSGGEIMQTIAAQVPALVGGSADLNPSTKTYLKEVGDFTPENRSGRNIHYGIRELAMGMISNGLALTNTIPFNSTFMVFSDYMKPALRLAALQQLKEIYVFTHDSIFVGEDGPTHQPIEQLAMFRSIPGLTTFRPAESNEVAQAWAAALQHQGPSVICLSRQTLPNMSADIVAKMDVAKGAYIVSSDADFDTIMIATGSELSISIEAADKLRKEGHKIRVISMPSWECFERQTAAYKESVIPAAITRRVSVEAGTTFGWAKYVGLNGISLGIDHFGSSAPYKKLAEEFGFNTEAVYEATKALYK